MQTEPWSCPVFIGFEDDGAVGAPARELVLQKEEKGLTDRGKRSKDGGTVRVMVDDGDLEKLESEAMTAGLSVADLIRARTLDAGNARSESYSDTERNLVAAWNLRVTRLDNKHEGVSASLDERIAAYYGWRGEGGSVASLLGPARASAGEHDRQPEGNVPTKPAVDPYEAVGVSGESRITVVADDKWTVNSRSRRAGGIWRIAELVTRAFAPSRSSQRHGGVAEKGKPQVRAGVMIVDPAADQRQGRPLD
jgi:hypothetical protein